MNVSSILNSTRPISLYDKEKDTRDTSFLDVLAQTTERKDDADLSELQASCNCELCKTDDDDNSISQDEDGEAEKIGFEACLECDGRENCKYYLRMTGASEEEIEKAILKSKSTNNNAFNKVGSIVQEQLYSSIFYNYNIICPEIEKKPKRDK